MNVTAHASWNSEREALVLDDPTTYRAGIKRLKPGAGERFVLTVMREEEAITAAQRKHYFGYIVRPLVEYTGYHQDEWHEMLKTLFMPDDGRTSITQLNHDEMRDYSERSNQYAHERFPEAFTLIDSRSA